MAWGTLIHGLLEHAMRHKAATREDLRRLAMWLTVEEPQLRPSSTKRSTPLSVPRRADFWSLAQSHVHSVETPFTVERFQRLTNGVIDLLFDSDAGWQVVDYKTDRSLDQELYSRQLEAYRSALKSTGCSVAGASVVSVRSELM